jgi:hypothetical protein
VDPERLHFFDPDSGVSISLSPPAPPAPPAAGPGLVLPMPGHETSPGPAFAFSNP